MAKYCPECGKPVADDSTKFCSNCGKRLPDSFPEQNAQSMSAPLPGTSSQTEPSIQGNTTKKLSTLQWIGIVFAGTVLIVVLFVILSIAFLTPVSTGIIKTSDTNFQNVITPVSNTSAATVVTTPYIDPYPDALPLNTAYHIENTLNNLRYPPENQSSPTKNDVSIQIKRALLWDSYTIQTPVKYQTVGPSADKKYAIIILEVTNYAGNAIVISPYPSNFILIYDSSPYLPEEIEFPVQAASISYKSEGIGRNEKAGGALVYEVPSSFTLNRSYIQLIYSDDNKKNPVWRMK
jgi:hypothetical protein